MLFPYHIHVPRHHRPIANWVIVVVTAGAFGLQYHAVESTVMHYPLQGWRLPGLITHLFMYANPLDAVNLFFLLLFGNAVCGRVGNIIYPVCYLLTGLAAAGTHLIADGGSSLGASGAISGIVGVFLVLYARDDVDCILVRGMSGMRRIRTHYAADSFGASPVQIVTLPAFWVIVFWAFINCGGIYIGGGVVSHFAHPAGFAAGAVFGAVLFLTGAVGMDPDELSPLKPLRDLMLTRQDARLKKEAMEALEAVRRQEALKTPQPAGSVQTVSGAPAEAAELIRFLCPCGQRMKAPGGAAGRICKCPKCSMELIVPSLQC